MATATGCALPDAFFELSYLDRNRRARYNPDFCTLDGERWFIRCVLPVPFAYRDGHWGFGIWVEVTQSQHDQARYRSSRARWPTNPRATAQHTAWRPSLCPIDQAIRPALRALLPFTSSPEVS